MKPSKYPLEYIDETIKLLHRAGDGKPDRELDLRIERVFNQSEIHDDHLDRFPASASQLTLSLDECRALMRRVYPEGRWVFGTDDGIGRYSASVVDPSIRGFYTGAPSLEVAILYVLLLKLYQVTKDAKCPSPSISSSAAN